MKKRKQYTHKRILYKTAELISDVIETDYGENPDKRVSQVAKHYLSRIYCQNTPAEDIQTKRSTMDGLLMNLSASQEHNAQERKKHLRERSGERSWNRKVA